MTIFTGKITFLSPIQQCQNTQSKTFSYGITHPTLLCCINLLPELTLLTALSVVLLLQPGICLAMTLSLAFHLLYLSLPFKTFLFHQTFRPSQFSRS